MSRRRFIKAASISAIFPIGFNNVFAQSNPLVLQTLTVWQNGVSLPSSTGQILDQASADAVIAASRAAAPGEGLVVNADGSITNPANGITILQGYVPAFPVYDTPPHPMNGGVPPAPPTIVPDTWGAGTWKPFFWGQSIAGNFGRERYTATGASLAWVGCYGVPAGAPAGTHGAYYPCSDPLIISDGSDGSPLSRLPDLAAGKPINGTHINRAVLGGCVRGGTSINDWAPGGSLNPLLLSTLTDYMSVVGMPTHLCFDQGEADALSMTSAQWLSQFDAMLTSIRNIGCTSPIWIANGAICNARDAANPPPNEASGRDALSLITREAGRQNIRIAQAQAAAINGNTNPGPNKDAVDWRLRAEGDGCHMGGRGLDSLARAWIAALFGP